MVAPPVQLALHLDAAADIADVDEAEHADTWYRWFVALPLDPAAPRAVADVDTASPARRAAWTVDARLTR